MLFRWLGKVIDLLWSEEPKGRFKKSRLKEKPRSQPGKKVVNKFANSEARGNIRGTEPNKKIPRILMNEEYKVGGPEMSKSREIHKGVCCFSWWNF